MLHENPCPFIGVCPHADMTCYGMKVFRCPYYPEYEKKTREELRKIIEELGINVENVPQSK